MARTRTKGSPAVLVLVGLVILLLGIFTILSSISNKKTLDKCTATVTGEVTNVKSVRHTAKKGKHGRRTYHTYTAEYTYEVDGVTYNDSVSMGQSKSRDRGSAIPVNYDPANPENNCTSYERSQNSNGYFTGGAMVLFSIIMVAAGIKGTKNNTINNTARAAAIPFAAQNMDNGFGSSSFNNSYNNYNNNFNSDLNNNPGSNYGGYDNNYNNNYNNYNNNNNYNNSYNNNYGGYQDNSGFSDNDFNQLN